MRKRNKKNEKKKPERKLNLRNKGKNDMSERRQYKLGKIKSRKK